MARQRDPGGGGSRREPLSAPVRLGTRGSALARAQTGEVARTLARTGIFEADATRTVTIRTSGDQLQTGSLAEVGGKSLFTTEIDLALLSGAVDVGVHSLKDVPASLPEGIVIACVLPREDPRDVLMGAPSIEALPHGAVLGTASPRRAAQVRNLRPDIAVTTLRGNIDTRLRKLADGEVDATLLAAAGLRRLGLGHAGGVVLPADVMLPAVAQGAICLAVRASDARLRERLGTLQDAPTERAVTCERALLAALDGSCRTPIAALASVGGDGSLRLRAALLSIDGRRRWDVRRMGAASEASVLGADAGAELRAVGGTDLPASG